MADGYADLLRTRHVLRLLAGTLAGRLPNATAPLAIVLFTRAHAGSYVLAGTLTAVYGLGTAVGQPWLGRLVDRHGQPAVMLSGALVCGAALSGLALNGPLPPWPAGALCGLAGLATPPLEGGLRALWPDIIAPRHDTESGAGPGAASGAGASEAGARDAHRPGRHAARLHTAYALDAAAQEVMFTVGPLLLSLAIAVTSTRAAVVALALLGVAGAVVVVTAPPVRRWRAEPREPHWLGPLRSPGIALLLGSFFFVGAALGGIGVAAVGYGERHGGGPVAGFLLSAVGFGALAGGLAYGARRWSGPPERRLRALSGCLALAYLPLVAVPGVAAMTALSALSGLFLAPVLACAFVVMDRHAPAGTVTEAFSWLVTAFGVGASAGSAVAGPATEYGGVAAGFAVAGVGGLIALLVLLAGGNVLTRTKPRQGKENESLATLGPGFSRTPRA